MKFRESGMPDEDYWESLFDVEAILSRFGFDAKTGDVAELGCGYGTFTIPLAKRIRGIVHAIDIDAAMVERTRQRAAAENLANVRPVQRDVAADGFGVLDDSCDACLLFNILHGEDPKGLLCAARESVHRGGLVAVIHWRADIVTPRGPSAAIRPKPGQILAWAAGAGDLAPALDAPVFPLPPWHYGLKLFKR